MAALREAGKPTTQEIHIMMGPIKIKATIHFAIDADGVMGHADVDLPVGDVPTREQLLVAVGAALAGMPKGARLLTDHEFLNHVMIAEKFGQPGNFAVPAAFSYDVSALVVEASEAAAAAKAAP